MLENIPFNLVASIIEINLVCIFPCETHEYLKVGTEFLPLYGPSSEYCHVEHNCNINAILLHFIPSQHSMQLSNVPAQEEKVEFPSDQQMDDHTPIYAWSPCFQSPLLHLHICKNSYPTIPSHKFPVTTLVSILDNNDHIPAWYIPCPKRGPST